MNEFKTDFAELPIIIDYGIDSDGEIIIQGFKIDRSEISDDDIYDMFASDIIEQQKELANDLKLERALEQLEDIKYRKQLYTVNKVKTDD